VRGVDHLQGPTSGGVCSTAPQIDASRGARYAVVSARCASRSSTAGPCEDAVLHHCRKRGSRPGARGRCLQHVEPARSGVTDWRTRGAASPGFVLGSYRRRTTRGDARQLIVSGDCGGDVAIYSRACAVTSRMGHVAPCVVFHQAGVPCAAQIRPVPCQRRSLRRKRFELGTSNRGGARSLCAIMPIASCGFQPYLSCAPRFRTLIGPCRSRTRRIGDGRERRGLAQARRRRFSRPQCRSAPPPHRRCDCP